MAELEDPSSSEYDATTHFEPVVLIQLARIYDVLLAMLMGINPEKAIQLARMHEAGEFLGAQPAIAIEDDDVTGE